MRFPAPLVLVLLALMGPPVRGDAAELTPETREFFESRVRPLLVERCYECHSGGAKNLKGGLRLDGRRHALAGGDSGPAVEPGKPEESLLIEAVRWQSYEMPPAGKLKPREVDVLVEWVRLGAPWPDAQAAEAGAGQDGAGKQGYDWQQWRQHWAFRPVARPETPAADSGWPQNGIDHFVLARLAAAQLTPAPPAPPRQLARRMHLGLLGIPPTPQEVESFVAAYADKPRQAVAERVDLLLERPQYGERWARHWLDVARYSDGFGGFLDNAGLPHAWRYRDWVVDALNRDLPFADFIRLQIAGDLLGDNQDAVATGFFALGPAYRSDGGDPDSVAQAKAETLSDRLDTLGRGMLALTLACARCHEHKFDPLPQQDYYSLAGVFDNSAVVEVPLAPPAEVRAYDQWQKQVSQLDQQIKKSEGEIKKARREATAEEQRQLDQWRKQLAGLRESAPAKYPVAHGLADRGSSDMRVAIRGDLRKPGGEAPRRFLRILAGEQREAFTDGSGRRQLAEAVAAEDNPLTARVFVNRVWMHHFGRGLVSTPSNFGALGERPTHPLLLDWLAAELLDSGGSIKQLHRTVMNSAAYQMSSQFDERAFAVDGDNRLLWRMSPRRLDVESWRDSLLAVTGELELTPGGPPTDDVSSRRRTLYFKVSRNGDQFASDKLLRLFDFPLMRATVDKRPVSIVPQQFLFLLNSDFMVQRARALEARLQQEASEGGRQRIERAYALLYGRPPRDSEIEAGLRFLAGGPTDKEQRPSDAEDQAKEGDELLIADFEQRDYGGWRTEGAAFGRGPARGTLPRQMAVSGFLGQGLVNSYLGGDGATGTLTSPPLTIELPFIHLLVGGGKYPGETCVNLLVDGEVVRTATGPNDRPGGSERLQWKRWDVRQLQGRQAVIRIVDRRTGGWGHINADHILQSRRPDPPQAPGDSGGSRPSGALTPWQQYLQVLLGANEFMYRP